MTAIAQRGFSAGEISPSLWPKVDQQRYATSLKTLRNFIIARNGGAYNRPGTVFGGEVKDSTQVVRLIPFVYNTSQTYVLEFGNLYMRVWQGGAQVVETAKTITNITQANPAVVTSTSHGFTNGQEVYITGVVGMAQVNNRNFKVAGVTTNTFQLQDMSSTNVDSTAYTAYSSAGTAARVYTIVTPYAATDLAAVRFVQSADVLTLVHPTYAPQQVQRTSNTSWTIGQISFSPINSTLTSPTVTAGAAGSNSFRYQISKTDPTGVTGTESYADMPSGQPGIGLETGKTITGITNANPAVVTVTAHGYQNGDTVGIISVTGTTNGLSSLNGAWYTIGGVTANTFQLSGIDTTTWTAYVSGGTSSRPYLRVDSCATGTAAAPVVVTWQTATGIKARYRVYRETGGLYGLVGEVDVNPATAIPLPTITFNDIGYTPDTTTTPQVYATTFSTTGSYPSCAAYYQQRLCFGNSTNAPTTVWTSKTGDYNNFSIKIPSTDSDGITFRMGGTQVNAVTHLLDMAQLLVFTTAGEWSCAGDGSGAIKPSAINMRQYSFNGSNNLRPLVINLSALYCQAQGQIVRDLAFDFVVSGYHGNDLTYWSQHLFEGYTLVDWDYQKTPNSIVWAVRSDGTLLSLTRIPEQQMLAWSRNDFTGGIVENVCCIPEGTEYYVYLVVRRTISGRSVRYIERMASRTIAQVNTKDFNFLDASMTYDGRNTGATTMTMSGSSDWLYTSDLTLTASSAYFTSSMVTNGDQIQITGADGTLIKCTLTVFTSSTVCTARPNKTVPVAMQGTAFTTWARGTNSVTGLWNLNGQNVSIYADGCVVANPNNPVYKAYSPSLGALTLDKPYTVIKVGLPYTCDMQTLDIDYPQGSIAHQAKLIRYLTIYLENSRSFWAGATVPATDAVPNNLGATSGATLVETKLRQYEGYDSPIALQTGKVDLNVAARMNGTGNVFFRGSDPTPLAFTGIIAIGEIPQPGK